MKIFDIIKKSFKEQIRQFWILLLIISMAPFFIFVYYLIIETSKVHYSLIIVNQDSGLPDQPGETNYGKDFIYFCKQKKKAQPVIPLRIKTADDMQTALRKVKKGSADALVVFPENFSRQLDDLKQSADAAQAEAEFSGDLTKLEYMLTALQAEELINDYVLHITGRAPPLKIKETALGSSAKIDDFTYSVPGLLILSVIMLMFTAAIALVTEVENKTMLRLKLSRLSGFEYLAGVSVVQAALGIIAILLSLATAAGLGFKFTGSLVPLIFIAALTSVSIIAFSLILAAATKTANEILIVGNFPLFLFMFFTGVAFPIKGQTLFTILNYPVTLPGLMSPYHAVSALRKIMIMNMGLQDVLPEIFALAVLTLLYFAAGAAAFQRRHMRVE